MLGSEQNLDLHKLFMMVKEKGGYDAVCKNKLWDLVGEEYGLGVKDGSFVKLVYSKYLSALETWPKNVAEGKFSECDLLDDRVKFGQCLLEVQSAFLLDDYGEDELKSECNYLDGWKLCGTHRVKCKNPGSNEAELDSVHDYLDGRILCGTNRVKTMNLESDGAKKVQNGGLVDLNMHDHRMNVPSLINMCNQNAAMEIMEEFDGGKVLTVDISDTVNSMPGLSNGRQRCKNGDDREDEDVMILDPSSVNKESFGCKRKRESMSEMLTWIADIAKNPGDPAVGSLPERSKWKSYSNQEIWKQVLLFREAVSLKKDFESSGEQRIWEGQKMHPSMYDDHLGATYNLRQRDKCDKKLLFGKSTVDGISSNSSGGTQGGLKRTPSSHIKDCAEKLLDSSTEHSSLDRCSTVYIPLGPAHQAVVPEWTGITCESDSKWLGTQIWPSKTSNSKLIEGDHIGKGRKDSCGCQVRGSVECVRFHIAEKRAKVKIELGVAFYEWNLHIVGEEVRRLWTEQEEKKFQDVVKSNPPSLDICFWDHIFRTFPMKSRENLVSYYFNVFLLQRRGYQNRHTEDNIDSDDDESEFGPLRNVFGHQTLKSRNFTLLSPKKPHTKRRYK